MSKLLEYSADVNICNNEGLTAVRGISFIWDLKKILWKIMVNVLLVQIIVQVFVQVTSVKFLWRIQWVY